MTLWQARDLALEDGQHLCLLGAPVRRRVLVAVVGADQGIQRVGSVLVGVVAGQTQLGQQNDPSITNLAPPQRVTDHVLQNALEQHRPLVRRTRHVAHAQLRHGVLDGVEGTLLVAQCEHRVPKRAALHPSQEPV